MKHILLLGILLISFVAEGFSKSGQLYEENFSSGLVEWTAVDLLGAKSLWHKITDHPMDTVSYHSPDTSFWCGVDADTFYADYMSDALLMNKTFDLSGKVKPLINFWYYLDIDADSRDTAMIEVSSDGGNSWDYAVGAWTTSSGSWQNISVDLSAYIDSSIQVRFRFISDNRNLIKSTGWFIDDILFADATSESTTYTTSIENDTDFITYNIIGSNTWEKSIDTAYSADTSFHSPIAATQWSCLQSKKLDFSSLNSPNLSFYHYYQFSYGPAISDWTNGGIVEITTDTTVDSAAWIKIYPKGGYPGYCSQQSLGNPLGDTLITGDSDVEGYYGWMKQWEKAEFDLSAYAGSSAVWIRFSAGADDYTGNIYSEKQWYIDDFVITEQGSYDTIYFCNMEDSNNTYLEAKGPVPGNWWQASHTGLSQLASSPAFYSSDSAAYCGNQTSRYHKGEYAPIDNGYALLDNALISPFIDISAVSGGDDLKLYFRNRRYAIYSAMLLVDARASDGSAWVAIDTFTTSTERKGVLGGWLPESIDLSAFSTSDSVALRFRTVCQNVNSRVYWYLDDLRLVYATTPMVDFVDIAVQVSSYNLTEKNDTFNVFGIEAFDNGGASPQVLTLTINDLDGGMNAADFGALSNGALSAISLYDSSGSRIAINEGASQWHGLIATVVLDTATAIPTVPVSINAYTVKLRTSVSIGNNCRFTVSILADTNLQTADNEMLGMGFAIVSDTFTVTNLVPDQISVFAATEAVDSTEATLIWGAVSASDLAAYNIYRDTIATFSLGAEKLFTSTAIIDTEYTDTSLVMGKTYYYKVVAIDSGDNIGSASVEDTITTNRVPDAPEGVSTLPDTSAQFITVSWNAMGGDIALYRIYRDTVSGFIPGAGNMLVTQAAPETTFNDSAVTTGNIYFYLVSAIDDVESEGPVSGEADSPVPVVLVSFTAEGIGANINLVWKTETEENNFGWNIYRRITGESVFIKINNRIIPGNGTSQTSQTYFYEDVNINTVESIEYYLEQVDFNATTSYSAVVSVVNNTTSMIGVQNSAKNACFTLLPSPFQNTLSITMESEVIGARGSVHIYDRAGNLVQHLTGNIGLGIQWDGRDALGKNVTSGIYLLVIKNGSVTENRWILKTD